jgi:hypothetical protein
MAPPVMPTQPPPPTAVTPVEPVNDPHGLGIFVSRLAGSSRKAGRTAVSVLGAVLEEGERVEALVQGRYRGEPGVCAVTDRGVVLVNESTYKPHVHRFAYSPDLAVQGWADDKVAAIVFTKGQENETIDRVADRDLARDLAQRIRARAGTT